MPFSRLLLRSWTAFRTVCRWIVFGAVPWKPATPQKALPSPISIIKLFPPTNKSTETNTLTTLPTSTPTLSPRKVTSDESRAHLHVVNGTIEEILRQYFNNLEDGGTAIVYTLPNGTQTVPRIESHTPHGVATYFDSNVNTVMILLIVALVIWIKRKTSSHWLPPSIIVNLDLPFPLINNCVGTTPMGALDAGDGQDVPLPRPKYVQTPLDGAGPVVDSKRNSTTTTGDDSRSEDTRKQIADLKAQVDRIEAKKPQEDTASLQRITFLHRKVRNLNSTVRRDKRYITRHEDTCSTIKKLTQNVEEQYLEYKDFKDGVAIQLEEAEQRHKKQYDDLLRQFEPIVTVINNPEIPLPAAIIPVISAPSSTPPSESAPVPFSVDIPLEPADISHDYSHSSNWERDDADLEACPEALQDEDTSVSLTTATRDLEASSTPADNIVNAPGAFTVTPENVTGTESALPFISPTTADTFWGNMEFPADAKPAELEVTSNDSEAAHPIHDIALLPELPERRSGSWFNPFVIKQNKRSVRKAQPPKRHRALKDRPTQPNFPRNSSQAASAPSRAASGGVSGSAPSSFEAPDFSNTIANISRDADNQVNGQNQLVREEEAGIEVDDMDVEKVAGIDADDFEVVVFDSLATGTSDGMDIATPSEGGDDVNNNVSDGMILDVGDEEGDLMLGDGDFDETVGAVLEETTNVVNTKEDDVTMSEEGDHSALIQSSDPRNGDADDTMNEEEDSWVPGQFNNHKEARQGSSQNCDENTNIFGGGIPFPEFPVFVPPQPEQPASGPAQTNPLNSNLPTNPFASGLSKAAARPYSHSASNTGAMELPFKIIERIPTPSNGLLCGLHALKLSMEAQHSDVQAPTIEELQQEFQDPGYQQTSKGAGIFNKKYLLYSQLVALLYLWGKRRGVNLQAVSYSPATGIISEPTGDQNNVRYVFIHNDDKERKNAFGIVTQMAHWEGMREGAIEDLNTAPEPGVFTKIQPDKVGSQGPGTSPGTTTNANIGQPLFSFESSKDVGGRGTPLATLAVLSEGLEGSGIAPPPENPPEAQPDRLADQKSGTSLDVSIDPISANTGQPTGQPLAQPPPALEPTEPLAFLVPRSIDGFDLVFSRHVRLGILLQAAMKNNIDTDGGASVAQLIEQCQEIEWAEFLTVPSSLKPKKIGAHSFDNKKFQRKQLRTLHKVYSEANEKYLMMKNPVLTVPELQRLALVVEEQIHREEASGENSRLPTEDGYKSRIAHEIARVEAMIDNQWWQYVVSFLSEDFNPEGEFPAHQFLRPEKVKNIKGSPIALPLRQVRLNNLYSVLGQLNFTSLREGSPTFSNVELIGLAKHLEEKHVSTMDGSGAPTFRSTYDYVHHTQSETHRYRYLNNARWSVTVKMHVGKREQFRERGSKADVLEEDELEHQSLLSEMFEQLEGNADERKESKGETKGRSQGETRKKMRR